jgi:hypothetical protein
MLNYSLFKRQSKSEKQYNVVEIQANMDILYSVQNHLNNQIIEDINSGCVK